MKPKQFYIKSLSDIDLAAKEFLSFMETIPNKKVFSFIGKMGAGKTTFIKALCKSLGVEDNVCSPTFAIVNVYKSNICTDVYHFDFYRLTNASQSLDIGIEEYFYSGNYCFMEWAENIQEYVPEDCVEVTISEQQDHSRLLTVNI